MNILNFVVHNFLPIVAIIGAIVLVVLKTIDFVKKPTDVQIKDLQEWLKGQVAEAEKELGSGTGELKLRIVYNAAIAKFPWVATYLTFDQFNNLVKIALDWMQKQMDENIAIKDYIKGKEE